MAGSGMLALVTDAFGGYGGIAQYNRDFLTAAAANPRLGPVVSLPRLAPEAAEPVPAPLRQLSPLHNRGAYMARAAEQALRLKPSIIFNGHLYHGPLSLALARQCGARLVSQVHGTEVWETIPRSALRALERSDLVLTVSRDTRARVLSQARIAPERVVVLNNTVGEAFRPEGREADRQRWGLGEEDTAVLTVARLDGRDGYKGHDRIIPLLPRLGEEHRKVTYLIAGIGPDRERLERLAADHGVAEQVRFLGKVPAEDLPGLYRAADLFALPSTGEGFGIAFLEAMACGTPAIGLAVGGVPDALCDGELGACVTAEAFPQAFAQALETCRQRRADLPARVRNHFGFPVYARRLNQLLDRTLAADPARPEP